MERIEAILNNQIEREQENATAQSPSPAIDKFDGNSLYSADPSLAHGVTIPGHAASAKEARIRNRRCASEDGSKAKLATEANQHRFQKRIETFVQTAEHSRERLVWLAQSMTRDRNEAEEVVQESLLKAFKSLPQFRGESQMSTWLGAIVRNTGHQWLRDRRSRAFISLDYVPASSEIPMVGDFPDPAISPEEHCLREELVDILHSEIDRLNPSCKDTIRMFALEESSHCEAARALGVSIATIKSRVFRGKRLLRQAVCQRTDRTREEGVKGLSCDVGRCIGPS